MNLRDRIQVQKLQGKSNISRGFVETDLEKARKAAIGEVRVHGGKKVKKVAEGKWDCC